jgi:tetratricopeptide (TPR) repeat protein
MQNSRFFLLFIVILTASGFTAGEEKAARPSTQESDSNRKGLQYFNDAFYRQLPKDNQRQADALFDLAIKKYKEAIAANPKLTDAHRNLARIYYVRKDFLQAANAYRMVTVLEPKDIDAYLQLALSYTQMSRFEEAIKALENAKTKTNDLETIGKLEEYIRKIRERN